MSRFSDTFGQLGDLNDQLETFEFNDFEYEITEQDINLEDNSAYIVFSLINKVRPVDDIWVLVKAAFNDLKYLELDLSAEFEDYDGNKIEEEEAKSILKLNDKEFFELINKIKQTADELLSTEIFVRVANEIE